MSRGSTSGGPTGRRSRSRSRDAQQLCRHRSSRSRNRSSCSSSKNNLRSGIGSPGCRRRSIKRHACGSSRPERDRNRDRERDRDECSSSSRRYNHHHLQQQQQQQRLLQPTGSHRSSRRPSVDAGGCSTAAAVSYRSSRDRSRERDRERDSSSRRGRSGRHRGRDRDSSRPPPLTDRGNRHCSSRHCSSRHCSSRHCSSRHCSSRPHRPSPSPGRIPTVKSRKHTGAAGGDYSKRRQYSGRWYGKEVRRRGSCSRSRSSSSKWHSSECSSGGSRRGGGERHRGAAAAPPPSAAASGGGRSSRKHSSPYKTRHYSPTNGRAAAPAAYSSKPNSSKHTQERRSRREAAGSSSKKSRVHSSQRHVQQHEDADSSDHHHQQQQQQQQQQPQHKTLRKQNKEANRDEITHFSWKPGLWLNNRYRVLAKLGDGTFGRVLRCVDVLLQTQVAIKVVRDVARYTAAAEIEADILRKLNRKDYRKDSGCVCLLDAFMYHKRHMCLVFECLGKSLYDVLSDNKYRGFYLQDIIEVARQGLNALAFMRDCKLAHTDLKPENILLRGEKMFETRAPRPSEEDDCSTPYLRPASMQVKIIDFGSATFEEDYHSSLINTRQYRAPEVILDIGWDMANDMWSLGCILMELYTGDVLFRTHEHLEHLAMMERIVEPFPKDMLQKAQKGAGKGYLTTDSRGEVRLKWPEGAASAGSVNRVKDCVPLEELVLPQDRLLADFVRYILQIDPRKRPDPKEALRHPIFSTGK